VAEAFASEGAHVVTCARDNERLNKAVNTLQEKYPQSKIFGQKTDVSKLEDIEALVQFVEEQFDGLDILVNNAGTGSAEKNMTAPDEKWYHYWDLHVMAAVRLARLCVPLMRKREGESVIVHTASICATQPLDYEPIYNVTKAALVMYSKCLANELIPENIRVNTISPGLIRTPDWDKTAAIVSKEKGMTPDEYLSNIAKENAPIARFASPEELAQFYLFLCSPQASYCVGSNYYVDGGWLKVIS
jgi:NAD(P)-dependent dehydrogenase (short-subunit alcohol dehydrogenase family)